MHFYKTVSARFLCSETYGNCRGLLEYFEKLSVSKTGNKIKLVDYCTRKRSTASCFFEEKDLEHFAHKKLLLKFIIFHFTFISAMMKVYSTNEIL